MTLTHRTAAAIALSICSSLASQSTLAEGYREARTALPNGAGQSVELFTGGRVYFDGSTDLILDRAGSTRTLLSLPGSTFGSFTVQVNPREVVFGESGTGNLWLVPLQPPGTPRILANLQFNFDAVLWLPNELLVSAKVGGFSSPDNEIVHVDLTTGATDTVAVVPGASGPLSVDADRSVFYATSSNAFPAPAGSTDIVRFAAQDIRSAVGADALTLADATLVVGGLNPLLALAADEDSDLFGVDFGIGGVLEFPSGPDGARPQERVLYLADPVGPAPTGLQYRGSQTSSEFEPFQPDLGGAQLHVTESTFGGSSRITTLQPQRPRTSVTRSLPGGFEIVLADGPANGAGLIVFSTINPGPFERPLQVGFDQPLFVSTASLNPAFTLSLAFDANGESRLPVAGPIATPLDFSTQTLFLDATGTTVGSTAAVLVQVR